MRTLGGFLAVSGAVWVGGLLAVNALDGGAQTWPLTFAMWSTPVVVAGTIATLLAKTSTQVTRCIAALWLVAVAGAFIVLSTGSGPSFSAAGAAVLFVTVAFAAWLLLPLMAWSHLAERDRG